VTGSSDKPVHPMLEEAGVHEEHRALLEKAQEVAHIGSWVAELDGSKRLSWSAETYRIFGVSVGDFPGTTDAFFLLVHPEDTVAVRAAIERAIEQHQQFDIEHRIVTGAGDVRWVHERADVIRDADSRPVRMIGTAQDITERRELELQLRHAQKMEAIGRLAGGVAHDLNNALTTIAGYTELALAELAEGHPARADVEEIRRAAARAESVTRKLLAFSRRQHLFESKEFDLNDVVGALARLLERTLGDNVSLRAELSATLPLVVGDRDQIEQAVVNLAVNARDAMPGGGDLVLRTSVEQVDEAFARAHATMPPGRFVVLSVADTGHGLDRETQARIFEPFFTTKEVGKGTGLGLAMVYGTVKQSGGFIFVESEPGHGATFRLYFPAVGSADMVAPQEPGHERPTRATILVVEDERSILNLIATTLRSEEYHLLKASSGAEALDAVAACDHPIDLVLTDATMPGMGGIELAHTLLTAHPAVPVIVMSGYTSVLNDLATDGKSFSLLPKPFTPTELRRRVREALTRPRS
jgi:two-component system cell cycle sensor histidine kinase/response regulator CckA